MTTATHSRAARRNFFRRALSGAALAVLATASTMETADAQGSYVSRSQRACIVYISDLDSPSQTWVQRQFYNFVEFAAEGLARGYLTPHYGNITVVKGPAATRLRLPTTLRNVALNPSIQAIDLLFVTHGLDGSVAFSDTDVSIGTVRNDIRSRVSSTLRRKFRMVFSTACYGASHLWGWRSAGFEAVSGSRDIYADSAMSFPAFLGAWASNYRFSSAVNVANSADPARVQDRIAESLLRSWGYSRWWDVDSVRLTSGRTWLRVYHRPF